jgi:hypothetical protein
MRLIRIEEARRELDDLQERGIDVTVLRAAVEQRESACRHMAATTRAALEMTAATLTEFVHSVDDVPDQILELIEIMERKLRQY